MDGPYTKLVNNKLFRKLLHNYILILIVLILLSMVFVETIGALKVISCITDKDSYFVGETITFTANLNGTVGDTVVLLIANSISNLSECNYTNRTSCIANSSNGTITVSSQYLTATMIASIDTNWYAKVCNISGYRMDMKENTTAWNITYPRGNYSDEARCIINDTNNNVYVVGYGKDLNGTTDKDWWIKKFTSDGNEDTTWNLTYDGNNSDDIAYSITTDTNNNIYIAGYGTNLNGTTDKDWWIMKLNSTGTRLWNKTYDANNSDDIAYSITTDTNNNVYVAGYGKDLNCSAGLDTGRDWWIKKFWGTNGTEDLTWNLTYDGTNDNDMAYSVTTDTNNNVYVVGFGVNLNGSTDSDWWIMKFDSTGTRLWNKTYDANNSNDIAYSVTTDTNNNIYVAGYGIANGTPPEDRDWWIMKFDSTGTRLWNKTYHGGNKSYDIAYSVTIDTNNNVYISGCGCGPSMPLSNYSWWIKKFEYITGVFTVFQPIIITNENPINGSTGVSLNPTLEIQVNHSNNYSMNITWYWGTDSGFPNLMGYNNTEINGTYRQTNVINFSLNSKTYYWRVTVNDGHGNWTNATYHFTTLNKYSEPGSSPSGTDSINTEDNPPTISNVNREPSGEITSIDYVTINTKVTDDYNVTSVILHWNDGSANTKIMKLINNDIYSTVIGPFLDGITVTFWINAIDNASQSTESNQYTFTVVDNSGPIITVINPASGSTIYDTTPAIKASYSDPSGIDTNTVILIVNDIDTTSGATVTSTSITYRPSTNMTYGEHPVKVIVSDNLGNTATKEWTFTIEQSKYLSEEELGNVSGGEETEITPESNETGIYSIDFTAATNLTNVKIFIAKLEDKPEEITLVPIYSGTIYAYLDIELTSDDENVEEDDIHSLEIKFKVEQTWIEENEIDINQIRLMRYHNNEWQNLTTILINEDETYAYFEAETQRLSTFAIVGGKAVETSEPYEAEGVQIPWPIIVGFIVSAIIILIVLLFKTGFIYIEEEYETIETTKKKK